MALQYPLASITAERLIGAAALTFIFATAITGGADQSYPALVLTAVLALLLFLSLLSSSVRLRLRFVPGLSVLAISFAVTVALACWSMTPWVPGGEHPVWTYVPTFGASTMDRSRTVIEIVKLLGLGSALLIGVVLGTGERTGRQVISLLLLYGALFCFWALYKLAGSTSATGLRLVGGLPSPNCAGTLLGSLVILTFPFFFRRDADRQPVRQGAVRLIQQMGPPAGLLLLFTAALVLTASRGAIGSLAIVAPLYLAWEALSGRIRWRTVGLGTVCVALASATLLLSKGTLVLERFGSITQDPAFSGRGPLFATHWTAFTDSPLFGYGLGTFDAVNKISLSSHSFAILWADRSAHNVYLQWLEEAGVIGALPMFVTISALIAIVVNKSSNRRQGKSWIKALVAVDLLFLIHGLSDFTLQVPSIGALWALLLGLQLGLVAPQRYLPA